MLRFLVRVMVLKIFCTSSTGSEGPSVKPAAREIKSGYFNFWSINHEMGGASMTITNLGGIGGIAFTPIVNPPEVAILGITRTAVEPIWDGKDFKPAPMVPLDLSYDHRVINGADAARFLSYFCSLIADPRGLLM